MNTYYKATHPDGTDFRTRTFNWDRVGDIVTHPDGPDFPTVPHQCGPAWLHVAKHKTSCVGFSWPCRLFEVEAVGQVADMGPEKVGVRQARIVRELPAHEALGPQGSEIAALIERVRESTPDETLSVILALDKTRYAVWEVAWDAARCVIRNGVRQAAVLAAREGARCCSWDAIEALCIRDLIGTGDWTQEHYDTLTAPVRQVLGKEWV